MTASGMDEVRALVRELLREVLPSLGALGRPRRVRVSDTAELNAFARTVIELLDDPVAGPQLRRGELTFELANEASRADPESPPTGSVPVIVVDNGVITERVVVRAVREKARIVAGAKVVITPLAREQIRRAKVEVEFR